MPPVVLGALQYGVLSPVPDRPSLRQEEKMGEIDFIRRWHTVFRDRGDDWHSCRLLKSEPVKAIYSLGESERGFLMSNGFIDYYELLQLSSNADTDTIERVFRHLAKKLHPDNKESADPDRFQLIVEAHRTLTDPETRAGYNVKYQEYWNRKWKLASEANDGTAFGDDREVRESLLSMLYVQLRRNMKHPGLGDYEMARLL